MIILYLAVLIIGTYLILKNLLPELSKPDKIKIIPRKNPIGLTQSDTVDNRIEKLETLISEKNKNIHFLQTELSIFLTQVREFDKVKILLEDEIHRLREQNRIFRSELGLPAAQTKEKSIV